MNIFELLIFVLFLCAMMLSLQGLSRVLAIPDALSLALVTATIMFGTRLFAKSSIKTVFRLGVFLFVAGFISLAIAGFSVRNNVIMIYPMVGIVIYLLVGMLMRLMPPKKPVQNGDTQ
jgi:hypothetical protein